MKKIFTTIFRALPIIILMSCTKYNNNGNPEMEGPMSETPTTLSNAGITSFAKGQAALLLTHLNGQVQHFSFHVIEDANGNVTGTWESKSPGQDLRTHGILTCLTFLDNNTAYMTGVVTQKIGEVFPGEYEVGMPVWFKVRDNGEGNNSNADEFTDYYSLQGIECVNYAQASMHAIISGNIQVRR